MAEQNNKPRRRGKYPDEVRVEAVRLLLDHVDRYDSEWQALNAIAGQVDVHPETLRVWVRKAQTDAGARPGVTSVEWAEIKRLQAEVKELRRANEILKAASAFFGAELDRQSKR